MVLSIQIQRQIYPFVFCTMDEKKKKKNLQSFGERKCILRDLRDVPACFLECVEKKAEGKSYKWRRATGVQGGMGDDRRVRLPEKILQS